MARLTVLMIAVAALFATSHGDPQVHAVLVAKLAAGDYSRRGADLCLTCHDEEEPFPTAAVFETLHGHPNVAGSPFEQDTAAFPAGLQCEACHGPAGNHGQRILGDGTAREPIVNFGQRGNAAADLQNQLCLACHADYSRAKWAGSTHEQAGMACADCHRVHATTDAVRSRNSQAAQCVGCHAGVGADMLKRSSHPMRRNQLICRDCHDPHGGEALLRDSAGNEACTRCHAELRGPFLWEHPPAAEDCGICHEPHGANQPALLVRRAPQLCQACHSSVGHRSWPQLPSSPSEPRAEFLFANACLNCHAQVHGSNHPSGNLLRR